MVLDKAFSRKKGDTGTDIYILAFKKGENWKREIITKVLESFMCAIQFGDLEVNVDDIVLNKETLHQIVYNKDYINESEYKNVLSQYILLNDEFVHEKEVDIQGYGEVKILLKDFNRQEEHLATNKCVMIRYPYMKITDMNIPFIKPCSAMCIIKNNKLNSILREVENPQHTDWEPNRLEELEDRREVKRTIRQIKNEIQEFAKECLLDSQNIEIDMEGAGDYLPDIEASDGISEASCQENVSMPKIINKQRNKIRNSLGDQEDDSNNSIMPDVGSSSDEGQECSVPTGHNGGNDGDVHDTNNLSGETDGEDIILKTVNLGGLKTRVILLDKNLGKYIVTFKSMYDEKNCDMEFFYLDDNGNKYKPSISLALVNGKLMQFEENKVKGFEIKSNCRYNIEIDTDLDDIYACEVKVYANR